MNNPCEKCPWVNNRGGVICYYCDDWLGKNYFRALVRVSKRKLTTLERLELETWRSKKGIT